MTISHDITKEPTSYWNSGNPVADTLWRHVKEDPHILTDTVRIVSAEVLLLATTQIKLVAAPGAGKVIQFISATLILDYGGTNAFTGDTNNLAIKYTDASGVAVSETIEMSSFIALTADTITKTLAVKDAVVTAAGSVNQALVLDNIGSNFGGNAGDDNVLIVKVSYIIHDVGLA